MKLKKLLRNLIKCKLGSSFPEGGVAQDPIIITYLIFPRNIFRIY